jgi:hypothetical protein
MSALYSIFAVIGPDGTNYEVPLDNKGALCRPKGKAAIAGRLLLAPAMGVSLDRAFSRGNDVFQYSRASRAVLN